MNRRAFLISSFMFGLLLATGIRPKHAPDLPANRPIWVRVSTDPTRNGYSHDGKTWISGNPPDGLLFASFECETGGRLWQDDPRHMPAWHNKGYDHASTSGLIR